MNNLLWIFCGLYTFVVFLIASRLFGIEEPRIGTRVIECLYKLYDYRDCTCHIYYTYYFKTTTVICAFTGVPTRTIKWYFKISVYGTTTRTTILLAHHTHILLQYTTLLSCRCTTIQLSHYTTAKKLPKPLLMYWYSTSPLYYCKKLPNFSWCTSILLAHYTTTGTRQAPGRSDGDQVWPLLIFIPILKSRIFVFLYKCIFISMCLSHNTGSCNQPRTSFCLFAYATIFEAPPQFIVFW